MPTLRATVARLRRPRWQVPLLDLLGAHRHPLERGVSFELPELLVAVIDRLEAVADAARDRFVDRNAGGIAVAEVVDVRPRLGRSNRLRRAVEKRERRKPARHH